MEPNVISAIVKKDLCVGCGLCAAICPDQTLVMQFNRFGEFNPILDHECKKNCGLCLKVCPFADGNDNEDSIGKRLYGDIPGICHRSETGYYLDCVAGYAPETRYRGASGGMATWFLSTIMRKGIVDYVIAVIPNEDPDSLFKFTILNDPDSVLDSAGSVYYPVELSGVLREVENNPGKYAIIGLPCFVKAIRLAMNHKRKLRERIIIIGGLVCGQMKSKHYTDHVSALSGVWGPLQKVYYRGKSRETPANIFYFSCVNKNGDKGKIFYNNGVSKVWNNRWFTLNACNFCDDIFAECADVAFMDAWLPEYASDCQGTSLLLVRSDLVKEVFDNERKVNTISINPISVQNVIQSQEGLVHIKKEYLSYRLYLNHRKGLSTPDKRITPKKISWSLFTRAEIEIKEHMRIASRNLWVEEQESGTGKLEKFYHTMNSYLVVLKIENILFTLVTLPMNALRFMQRKIRRF